MNKTEKALLARGFDTKLIDSLLAKGYSLSKLKTMPENELLSLGISLKLIEIIKKECRPPISDKIISKLLYDSKMTCCICRENNKPIIIHHINPWNISNDNSENNLVILCLEHHDLAHTKKELSINLTPERIRNSKEKWIESVRLGDSNQAIKLNSMVSDQSELITLFQQFSLDKNSEANVQNWFIGAKPDSHIVWNTIGIESNDEMGYYRKGTVPIKINGKPYFKLEKNIVPVNWNIILNGPRAGVTSFQLFPEIMSQEIDHGKILEYFEENDFVLNFIEGDEKGLASRGFDLYELLIPEREQGYLLVKYEYASAGGFICFTYYYEKPDNDVLEIEI